MGDPTSRVAMFLHIIFHMRNRWENKLPPSSNDIVFCCAFAFYISKSTELELALFSVTFVYLYSSLAILFWHGSLALLNVSWRWSIISCLFLHLQLLGHAFVRSHDRNVCDAGHVSNLCRDEAKTSQSTGLLVYDFPYNALAVLLLLNHP